MYGYRGLTMIEDTEDDVIIDSDGNTIKACDVV